MIAGALAWGEPVVTSPDDMEPTMVTYPAAGNPDRRRPIADAAAGMPVPLTQYPATNPTSARSDTR